MIIRFTILLLALCFTGVWFAGIFFDSERERYILRGMKAGLIVAILMVGMVNVFKEVIIKGYQKKQLS